MLRRAARRSGGASSGNGGRSRLATQWMGGVAVVARQPDGALTAAVSFIAKSFNSGAHLISFSVARRSPSAMRTVPVSAWSDRCARGRRSSELALAAANEHAASQMRVSEQKPTPSASILENELANWGSKLMKKVSIFGLLRLLSRLVGPIHFALLDCPDDLLAERLRARPTWRGTSSQAKITEHQRFAAWLRARITPSFDTGAASPAEIADQVAAWIRPLLTSPAQ